MKPFHDGLVGSSRFNTNYRRGSAAPDAVVRYTTNNSTPTSGSAAFPGGGYYVPNNTTVHIKARTFATGFADSDTLDFTVHVNPVGP